MSFFSHCDVKYLTEPCHNDIIRLVDDTWIEAQIFHSSLGFYSATDAMLGGQCLLLADSILSHIPGQTTTLVAAGGLCQV
jgi:hypothetical protein